MSENVLRVIVVDVEVADVMNRFRTASLVYPYSIN